MTPTARHRWTAHFRAWLLLCTAAVTPLQAGSSIASPQVIVNPGVPEESLTRSTLRTIFAMRLRTWSDGKPIRVFVLKDKTPNHVQFCKNVLHVFPYQLRSSWDRLIFSGTGQAPIQVSTEDEMRRKVANSPGAIGYLQRSMINDAVRVLPTP